MEDIQAALSRENKRLDRVRGLMEYYRDGTPVSNAVDVKVHSLFVDVEIHEGKLWAVATLERSDELTTAELADLKDYLSGQYSDGFGEGFEQREITVGIQELYVHLWSSGDDFFIDTEREFRQRLGLETEVPEEPASEYSLRGYFENPDRPQDGGFSMPLPTTAEALAPFLEELGITDIHNVKVGEVSSEYERDFKLGHYLNKALRDMQVPNSLEELNYLAARIVNMTDEQKELFAAVLEAKWNCNTIGEMINLTENLDCFELSPAYCVASYGEHLFTSAQNDIRGVMQRLAYSGNSADEMLATHIERLEACVDLEAYGDIALQEESGVFTDFGYLQHVHGVRKHYRDVQDIPAEYRISEDRAAPVREAAEKPSLKETLKQNAQRSREQFGAPTPSTEKKKEDPSL